MLDVAYCCDNGYIPYVSVSMISCIENNINDFDRKFKDATARIRLAGDITRLPEYLQEKVKNIEDRTKNNTGLTVNLCINYGGREEIVNATKILAEKVKKGELNIKLNNNNYTAKENEIIFINPDTVHQATPQDCIYECIVLNLDFFPALGNGPVYFTESFKNHEYIVDEYHRETDNSFGKAVNDLFRVMSAKSSGYKF